MRSRRRSLAPPSTQRGVALMVIMVMLLVMMVIGLAILRGTALEERMSAAMYDRSLAFEAAERALREAEKQVADAVKNSRAIGVDCTLPTISCAPLPSSTYTGGSVCADAKGDCWVNASAGDAALPVAGRAQYYVQFMGQRTTVDDFGTANGGSYEPPPAKEFTGAFYRVTARSHDPSGAGERAVVVLQTTLVSY
ncbi:PilX protein [Lysobacter sp. K5869]|uniref:pilus assembly PilX family protein n=1 Tax=Lysobacter sp. K5869 TaxID=2820808 RepID=UPI001C06178F|nr:PilX N-terminal domain-containing pilus assembly protein [Lysobacter sp. K5869]QWP79016.1 PilX protein [Lysobacter sp. K5869]